MSINKNPKLYHWMTNHQLDLNTSTSPLKSSEISLRVGIGGRSQMILMAKEVPYFALNCVLKT